MKRLTMLSAIVLLLACPGVSQCLADWVVDGSFETQTTVPPWQPSTTGVWQGDASEIVTEQNGVTPIDGARMFAFRGCYGIPGYGGINGGLWQLIELDTIADYVDTGSATATLSANVNRASNAANGRVVMRLSAYSGHVSTFPSQYQDNGAGSLATSAVSLTADGDPSSWQFLTVSLVLPKETDFLAVEFIAWNDANQSYPAFTGLYVDATSVDITAVPAPATVLVFYNNSAWDAGDPAANEADDYAIAIDKVALRHGQKATFANYTSYSQGINGLMIDMPDLPGTPTLNDFLFRMGNDSKPYGNDLEDPDDDWPWAPDPIEITVRPGEGQYGTDRVTLIWEDGAIRKCWLQVTVLATDATGLDRDNVFYVGNAVGDSGNSATDTAVNVVDALGVRANPHTLLRPAPIDDAYDYNRDGQVNVRDELIVRANPTTLLTDLNLIDLR